MRKLMLSLVGSTALALASAANAGITFTGSTTGCFGSPCTPTPSATDNGLTFNSGTFSQSTDATGFAAIGGITNNFGTITLVPSTHSYTGDLFDLLISFTAPPGTGSGSFTADLLGSLTSTSVGGLQINFSNPTQQISDGMGGFYTLHVNDVAFSGGLSDNLYTTLLSQNISGYIIAAVPEPATWALMLLGFGGIGFAMRRSRKPALAQLA